jgi:putative ABC transport system substrate-binding protein
MLSRWLEQRMQFDRFRRRDLIALVGAAAAFAPASTSAQGPGRIYRLGFLIPTARDAAVTMAFFDELRAAGFAEGQNLSILPGGFGVPVEQIDQVARAMVKAAPDAIVAGPELQLRALQALTRTIPLIGMTEDMVADGLVASLAHPGGNITGISLLSPELDGKRQDILIEAVPRLGRMAVLNDANVTPAQHLDELRSAARARGIELSTIGVSTADRIVPAIDEAKTSGAQAINFLATPLFFVNRRLIFERVTKALVPAIYQWPEMAEDGGLAGYGSRFAQVYRQRARIVAKVLRGTKPADIPVEQPTRFELVINLKAASAIGHEVPAGLEKGLDVAIKHPVDAPPTNPERECIQRLVLIALRSEPVAESQELRLVNRRQDRNHRRLDDLIFQCSDAERPLSAICLWNISPARWQRSIRSRLDASVEVREVLLKAFRVFGPGQLVDARRGGLLQTKEACPQNIDGEVMQERRQLVLSVPVDGFSYAGLRL